MAGKQIFETFTKTTNYDTNKIINSSKNRESSSPKHLIETFDFNGENSLNKKEDDYYFHPSSNNSFEWKIPKDSIKHMNDEISGSGDAERQRRIDYLGGMKETEEEQKEMMTTINVPIWDGEKETTMQLTVNKKLVTNYMTAFREVCDLRYPIKTDSNENAFYAYAWDHVRPNGERSDHAYGGTFDINTKDNYESGNGSKYSVRTRPDVIAAFEKQGFFWGGNWDTSKDDMHFSFTGY